MTLEKEWIIQYLSRRKQTTEKSVISEMQGETFMQKWL